MAKQHGEGLDGCAGCASSGACGSPVSLPRLEAGDVLGPGQRQQVAQFGGVEEVGRADRRVGARLQTRARVTARTRSPSTSAATGLWRSSSGSCPPLDVRRQHRFEHRQRDARLVVRRETLPSPGLRCALRARLRGQRVVVAVVVADAVAVGAVAPRAAERLDPGVLVGRDGLRGELAADPVGLLGHHHAQAVAQRGQRGGAAAGAAADDRHVAAHSRGAAAGPAKQRCRRNCFQGRSAAHLRCWYHIMSRSLGLSASRQVMAVITVSGEPGCTMRKWPGWSRSGCFRAGERLGLARCWTRSSAPTAQSRTRLAHGRSYPGAAGHRATWWWRRGAELCSATSRLAARARRGAAAAVGN